MGNHNANKAVKFWLLLCCAMVAAMIVLGAITRLTQSGLSITRWDVIAGILPPLTDQDWQAAFSLYQATPQYRFENQGMSLEAFRQIYFWEWLHRLWGRMTGLVFALPLGLFWLKGVLSPGAAVRLLAIFALGALQGLAGWLMVQSGLSERTSVMPWRLALHLDLALLLYGLLLWNALSVEAGSPRPCSHGVRRQGQATLLLLLLTITLGALVAGSFGGSIYNSWPLMDGDWLPSTAFTLDPWWANLVENPVLLQFLHRWAGPLTLLAVLGWVWRCRREDPSWAGGLLPLALWILVQVGLGLATLLSGASPLIAALHQAGAVMLLTLMLNALFHRRADGPGR